MLKEHKFYIYHDDNIVYARMGERDPVVAYTCENAQEAYEKVQSIINPERRSAESFGSQGFNSDEFQTSISENCKSVVKAAYKSKD